MAFKTHKINGVEYKKCPVPFFNLCKGCELECAPFKAPPIQDDDSGEALNCVDPPSIFKRVKS